MRTFVLPSFVAFASCVILQASSKQHHLSSENPGDIPPKHLQTSFQAPWITVTDIQGSAFQSPLAGQTVRNLTGVVTAKGSVGFWISGDRVHDPRISNGLNIYTNDAVILSQVKVGDNISLGGKVTEYRDSSSPNNLFATEITFPTNITVISSGHSVQPVVLGKDKSPPTLLLSALDQGKDGWLSVPANQSRIEEVNSTLQPHLYGLDFWESLEGQLVTITNPVAINFPNGHREFWVHGNWPVTGKNGRGGLTITLGPGGIPDSNPEAVVIGTPLDKTKNPGVAVGTKLSNITGVVVYQYGFFYVLPLTAPGTRRNDSCAFVFGDYNVENMSPKSAHLPAVATHIATFLKTPDLMFVQEIQDDDGPTSNGTVSANVTLQTLVDAIADASGGVRYSFIDIPPVDLQDGGQPGGNIRQAYLYRTEKLSLVTGSPVGGSLDGTKVVTGPYGKPMLSFNPGRIDPTNSAWEDSRKPLVALWQTAAGHRVFTINVHFTSKTDSSSTHGDARTPVNAGSDQRTQQVKTTAAFVRSILSEDRNANIIVGGDMNEYIQTRSVFAPFDGILDELADHDPVERYTYVFEQSSQQIDHIFVSEAIKNRGTAVEHVHVNNWAPSLSARVSDHDPSVAKIKIC